MLVGRDSDPYSEDQGDSQRVQKSGQLSDGKSLSQGRVILDANRDLGDLPPGRGGSERGQAGAVLRRSRSDLAAIREPSVALQGAGYLSDLPDRNTAWAQSNRLPTDEPALFYPPAGRPESNHGKIRELIL